MSIKIKELVLEVNGKLLLDNVNLNLEENIIYYLSGIMGSGKSTLLNHLALEHNNYPPGTNILCSFIESEKLIFSELNVLCNLQFYKALFKTSNEDYDRLITYFNLEKMYKTKVEDLSSGNQQLVYLVCSLLNAQARFILLDEPFVNIDVEAKELILNYLELLSPGRIIIFTSHEFDPATRDYQHITIEDKGLLCL